MSPVRRLLARPWPAALLCAAALFLKLLVPSGYMLAGEHGRITVTICSGVAGQAMTMAMPGMGGAMPGHDKGEHGKAETPCPFAGLSAPALGGAGPVLLAVLVAYVLATGLAAARPPARIRRAYLRPPLRGPPTTV